jgi:iron complex outermembrane receptor protein
MDPFERKRYWQFPAVTKSGLHLNTLTGLGEKASLRTRWYADTYFSELKSFDDSTYSNQDFRSSFTSIYRDLSLGGAAIMSYRAHERHDIRMSLHGIYDLHREGNIHPMEEQERQFRDLSLSLALEDDFRLGERLRVRLGAGLQFRENLRADDYNAALDSIFPFPVNQDVAMNLLAALRWQLSANQDIGLNLSRKSRFPTMKDRFSYRLGRSLPNPGLDAEFAWNVDLAYRLHTPDGLSFSSSLFYSHLPQVIQAVYGIDPGDPSIYQLQNTGQARFYGLETRFGVVMFRNLDVSLTYSLVERENLDHPEIRFTDVPRHKFNAQLAYSLKDILFAYVGIQYISERLRTSDGQYVADAFATMDVGAEIRLRALSLTLACSNLLDLSYAWMEGYLAPGRSFHAGVSFRFNRP